MSALDGWIDVCRAGTWRDMAGRDVAIDEARLDRIVDAHAVADPAPVVVGHPETDAPAFAWIDGLRRVGDRLQAKLRDIAPAFENAPVQHIVRVGVSVMVAAPNDRGGARGRERLSALLARARQALAGWTPPGQREVLSFRRGRLVSLEDGRMQWLDEYEIRRVARAGVVETE